MKTYIVGHKNPDADSIISAIAYADFKTKNGEVDVVAACLGEPNNETRFILDKFGVNDPELITDGTDKKIILVDHNQEYQTIDNYLKADIVEILDHHNVNFSYGKPILIHTEVAGATATLIAEKYFNTNTELSKEIAGILLGAIISDCVIFKSPVTTPRDIEISAKLAKIAEIEDTTAFGMEIFKAKSVWDSMEAEDIVEMDRKEYDMSGTKVSVAQVETVDYTDLAKRKNEFVEVLKGLNEKGNKLAVVLITDIIKEGCLLIATGQTEKLEETFGKPLEDNSVWLDGVLSRKTQVIPPLEKVF